MATAQSGIRSAGLGNGKDQKTVAARAVKQDLHEAQEAASNFVSAVKSSASNFGEHVQQRVAEQAAIAVQKVRGAKAKAEDKVRERPLAAIGLAAGVGILVGLLTRR